MQLRGAYTGAMLGAPALAIMIGAARRRGVLALVPAWMVSAGMLYPIAAGAFAPAYRNQAPGSATAPASCASPQTIAALDRLAPGMVMAPIDVAPWGIAETRHRFVAGPYHRNTAGNLAMYGFFLGNADQARAIARRWNVRYVVYCEGDLGDARSVSGRLAGSSGSMAHDLASRRIPAWLKPLDSPRGTIFQAVR
ncbi:MAG: hypothetical protein EOP67_53775 [Sphingomonas sp.]|nr:MAG: hypothetical protein EOP67_53775 [Sphingomonas sp.]